VERLPGEVDAMMRSTRCMNCQASLDESQRAHCSDRCRAATYARIDALKPAQPKKRRSR
jgi:uncharacterized paraquat-inducible protein A